MVKLNLDTRIVYTSRLYWWSLPKAMRSCPQNPQLADVISKCTSLPVLRILFLLLAVVDSQSSTCVQARSILGCAPVGAASHHMNMLQIGKELAGRNHSFTLLVSSTDCFSLDIVRARRFANLNVIQFKGTQAELAPGTDAWAASLSRTTQEVCILILLPFLSYGFARCT